MGYQEYRAECASPKRASHLVGDIGITPCGYNRVFTSERAATLALRGHLRSEHNVDPDAGTGSTTYYGRVIPHPPPPAITTRRRYRGTGGDPTGV